MSGNELCDLNPIYPGKHLTEFSTHGMRILWLLPGQGDEIISCTLESISFYSEKAEFTALSYVWGKQTDVRRIILDGEDYFVTRHLEAALRNLRYAGVRRAFWIDQLCINQRSVVERNQQVNLMRSIYNLAQEVAVCLHEVVDATWQAKSRIDVKGIAPSTVAARKLNQRDAVSLLNLLLRVDSGQCLLAGEPETQGMITALCKFLSSTWFTRIWTVQEMVVNAQVYFILGAMTISWSDLLSMVQYCKLHMHRKCCCFQHETYHSKMASIIPQMNEVELLEELRDDLETEVMMELEVLLTIFRHRQATDPRDKVFGLLGIAKPLWLNGSIMVADYDLSAAQVCRLIATASLERWSRASNLNFLMDDLVDAARQLSLPSWVPDWTASLNDLHASVYRSLRLEAGVYNASNGHEKHVELSNDSLDELHARGVMVDQVHTVVQHFSAIDPSDGPTGSLELLREEYDCLFDQMKDKTELSRSREHVFWRLLCMDLDVWVDLRGTVPKSSFSRMVSRDYRDTTKDQTLARFKAATPGKSDGWDSQPFVAWQSFKMFVTDGGRFGMGPLTMQSSDHVCILLGADMPFVIRPVIDQVAETTRYQLVGFCYVDGIMDGEMLQDGSLSWITERTQWITLV